MFFLNYGKESMRIKNLILDPRNFFSPSIIEKRKPLSNQARRKGWVGCNILIDSIPASGKIFIVQNGQVFPKETIRQQWERLSFLKKSPNMKAQSWIVDTIDCIEKLGKSTFSLGDIDQFENELSRKYPENKHIKDKIRQQLQVLRDKKMLTFLGGGKYSVVF